MKKWGYVLLLVFIGVAAYQFGYYQNKLLASELDKQQLFSDLKTQEKSDMVFDASIPRSITMPPAALNTRTMSEPEEKIQQYFTLHPSAEHLLLHSVQCNLKGCELTGQYHGKTEELKVMVEQMRDQSWWRYSTLQNHNTRQGDTTHFVVQLSRNARS